MQKMKKNIWTFFFVAEFFIGIAVFFFQCKKSDASPGNGGTPSGPATNEVWIQGNSFNPASLTVPVNTTVKWTNKDAAAHTVTSTSGAFDSGNIVSGNVYTKQFTTAGTYPYKCTLHSNMNGTIIVQ